jgi:SAM-dependent methyltransferase
LDGTGRLLDVGTGPGILALRLAGLFAEVVALDPDADMLFEGRAEATRRGIANIVWVRGVAEALPDAAPGPYRLVAFGQSFHRTDELKVAETVYDMLQPGGAIALVVPTVDGRPVPPNPGAPPIPHDEMRELVRSYLGPVPRAGQGYARPRNHRFEDVLRMTRFGEPARAFAPGVPDLIRDIDSVVSGYLSMSTSAPHLFGDRLEDFIADMKHLLSEHATDGMFWDWPGDTEVVLGFRPQTA